MSVVVVTGCSSGFGLGIAVGFAKRGDQVIATMRDSSKSERLREELTSAGVSAEIRELDVIVPESRESLVESVLGDFGQIDVLVNNAGIASLGAIEDTPDEVARDIFETNYWGPLELTKLVLPSMRERRSGRVVNVSSIGALMLSRWQGPYCASKHALDAMTATLDLELEPFRVRVLSVLPGTYGTDITENAALVAPPDSPYGSAARESHSRWQELLGSVRDLTPVVDAVIELATAEDPSARRFVSGSGGPFAELISAAVEAHEALDAPWRNQR